MCFAMEIQKIGLKCAKLVANTAPVQVELKEVQIQQSMQRALAAVAEVSRIELVSLQTCIDKLHHTAAWSFRSCLDRHLPLLAVSKPWFKANFWVAETIYVAGLGFMGILFVNLWPDLFCWRQVLWLCQRVAVTCWGSARGWGKVDSSTCTKGICQYPCRGFQGWTEEKISDIADLWDVAVSSVEKNWTPLGTTKSFFDDDGMQAAYPLSACQRVAGFRPWETTQLLFNFNGSKLKVLISWVFCGTWFGHPFSIIHLIQLTWVLWLGMFTTDESL